MSRARVLVIDDDPLFRSLIVAMLRKDFLVSVANDGAEGYYKSLEHPPQLAVVDIRMPGWDGLRTLKAFRTHHALTHIPVMMLTSDSSRQTVLAAIQAGANDYVIKTSLTKDDFLRKACRLLNLDPQTLEAQDTKAEESADAKPAQEVAPRANEPDVAVVSSGADVPHPPINETAMLQAIIDNWE